MEVDGLCFEGCGIGGVFRDVGNGGLVVARGVGCCGDWSGDGEAFFGFFGAWGLNNSVVVGLSGKFLSIFFKLFWKGNIMHLLHV